MSPVLVGVRTLDEIVPSLGAQMQERWLRSMRTRTFWVQRMLEVRVSVADGTGIRKEWDNTSGRVTYE